MSLKTKIALVSSDILTLLFYLFYLFQYRIEFAIRLVEENVSCIGYICKLFIDDYVEQKKEEREITIELLEEDDEQDSEEREEIPRKSKGKKRSETDAKDC